MTFERVKKIILETLNCDEEDIVPEAYLQNDLGADSLDGVELIMALEDEFGISFPEDAALKFRTVEDIVSFVDNSDKG